MKHDEGGRFSTAKVHMMKRKYLALISDQHVTEPGTTLYGLETNKSTARLSTFLQKEPLVEAIVSLGDLADTTLNPNRTEATASSAAYENTMIHRS